MNTRKNIDYSELFAAVDRAVNAELPQMELYREIGRLVCDRPEKGAAVAVAEHLQSAYPDMTGFSPRNVRRMRDFYRKYENAPGVMREAMRLGWTQNLILMDADLILRNALGISVPRYGSGGPKRSSRTKSLSRRLRISLSTLRRMYVMMRIPPQVPMTGMPRRFPEQRTAKPNPHSILRAFHARFYLLKSCAQKNI